MKTKNQFTAIHRVIHWLVALLMLILFFTGFLRMYWMNKKTIISAVEVGTQSQQIPVEKAQLITIVKTIQEPMWQWHEFAAYVMCFAFLTRVVYMIVKGIKFPNPFIKQQSAKERFQGFIYVAFYLFISLSIITGFYLKWIDGDWKGPMEIIHKWAIYWFPIFIFLHFLGILIGELTNKKGIVSRMIGGDK